MVCDISNIKIEEFLVFCTDVETRNIQKCTVVKGLYTMIVVLFLLKQKWLLNLCDRRSSVSHYHGTRISSKFIDDELNFPLAFS